jgi:hypothetical protein
VEAPDIGLTTIEYQKGVLQRTITDSDSCRIIVNIEAGVEVEVTIAA